MRRCARLLGIELKLPRGDDLREANEKYGVDNRISA